MAGSHLRIGGSRHRPPEPISALQLAAIVALLGVGIGYAASTYTPPSTPLLLAGGIGFAGLLALTLARYDAAVALGFLLLGVVAVEPAPPDAILAVVIAIAAVTGRFDITRVPLVVFVTLGSFLALNLLSMVDAIAIERAFFYFAITLYLGVFAIWLSSYITSERRARIVLVAYVAGAVASSLFGLFALLVGFPGSDNFVFLDTRAQGLFKDANVFGPFMVPAILIMLQETLSPRLLKLSPPIKLLLILILILGVVFSFSRAAWLNLGLGLVVLFTVMLLRREGGARMAFVAGATALAGFATAGFVVATGSDDFLTERATIQAYDTERFQAQEAGIELARQHPFGAGPGQFEPLVQYSAHSTYIRSFAEQGALGVLALGSLFLATLVLGVRNAAVGRSAFGIGSAAVLAAWCGLLANSVFVDTLHWRHLWFVAGLIWLASIRPPERERAG